MGETKRLIEEAFPLEQTSQDSVHEKSVRPGHLSTLHIWPARRPLAASRAVVLTTLLSAPDTPEECNNLVRRMATGISCTTEGKGESITSWIGTPPKTGKSAKKNYEERVKKRESELDFFREEIRKAHGGRAPRFLDPFSGGGAIPLEAMRLGCETYAMDINPVACFVLRGTLEYPQRLAGETYPLPRFILDDKSFMEAFYKANPKLAPQLQGNLLKEHSQEIPSADLAWQIRAWGGGILKEARKTLGNFYPTYAEFEPWIKKGAYDYKKQEPRLVPILEDGSLDIASLNSEFSEEYLRDGANARWIEKPTVAYLWARTCRCSSCRAEIPLLKTKWLCKKEDKRVLLIATSKEDKSGVTFEVQENVPELEGASSRQRLAYDDKIGAGYMSRTGVTCPCCGATMTMEDLRREGKAGCLGVIMTAVVYEQTNAKGKRYRRPTNHEIECALDSEKKLNDIYADIPFGIPNEPTPNETALGMRIPKYGFSKWSNLFSPRQLLALGVFCREIRNVINQCDGMGYQNKWVEAIGTYLAITLDKLADYLSMLCIWGISREGISHTFARFALPMTWDFVEGNPLSSSTGSFLSGLECNALYLECNTQNYSNYKKPVIINQSCIDNLPENIDCIITDPPYYDSIPYSDCMDFFYIWIKRIIYKTVLDKGEFTNQLNPKWDNNAKNGELIDDASRHNGDKTASKKAYEDGMATVFRRCYSALVADGRLVIAFANKSPDAWETLVSAIIRAGFVVTASWPIATELQTRMRATNSAALSSSVWLVCKKRGFARPGWDNKVLENMRSKIKERLYAFWDAGVRGPDFLWAATGPALEAYSAYPIVKKANVASGVMSVAEFLSEVRRLVVEFVVGRMIDHKDQEETSLDSVTSYYILHRNDFGMEDAPAGACILYATACGTSDKELSTVWNIIKNGKNNQSKEQEIEGYQEGISGSSSKFRLVKWSDRKQASLGLDGKNGRTVPLIDRLHKLMQLWKKGVIKDVDEYLNAYALRTNSIFPNLIQALIEISSPDQKDEERAILESISNHIYGYKTKRSNMEQGLLI